MRYLITRVLAFLELASAISAAPLLRNSLEQPAHARRRVSYSVVAVDGGSAATSSSPSSPTNTVTLTVSATKTVKQSTTITVSSTCSLRTTSASISTLTVTKTAPTTTVVRTVTEYPAPSVPAASLVSTRTVISTIRADTTSEASTASFSAVSATPDVFPSTKPSAAGASTMVQMPSVKASYGIPLVPTTYITEPNAAYTASRAWNTTVTSNCFATSASQNTARASSDAWSHMS